MSVSIQKKKNSYKNYAVNSEVPRHGLNVQNKENTPQTLMVRQGKPSLTDYRSKVSLKFVYSKIDDINFKKYNYIKIKFSFGCYYNKHLS